MREAYRAPISLEAGCKHAAGPELRRPSDDRAGAAKASQTHIVGSGAGKIRESPGLGCWAPANFPRVEHMFEQVGERYSVEELSAAGLLRAARVAQAHARQAEADLLVCALQWAIVHPSSDGSADAEDAAVFFDASGVERIAGIGCPGVAEFSIAEFGTELGLSTIAAKRLIGHALELAHRLPRTWRRVLNGDVDPWRARRVAEATIHADPALPSEAVAWVDAQAAPFANRIGQAQVDRLVAAAILRFQLERPDADSAGAIDSLHVTLGNAGETSVGTIDVSATLTTAGALDLDNALRAAAEELKALGSPEPLGARRARALGQMARRQTAFELADLASDDAQGDRPRAARRLDLHLHFQADADGAGSVGFLESGQRLVLLQQVKQWLGDSGTELRVLPVLDLAEEIECDGYVASPRLRRQVLLRDGTCVFPWCSRPARACDLDHVVPYDPSRRSNGAGQTRSSNLAALCRSHHRLKTHSG